MLTLLKVFKKKEINGETYYDQRGIERLIEENKNKYFIQHHLF